jgi:hypothetical protein
MGTFRNFRLSTIKKTSLVFLSALCFFSCNVIHIYTKKEAIKNAKYVEKKTKQHIEIQDNDRFLKLSSVDSNSQKLDVLIEFDNYDRQVHFTVKTNCDSCTDKLLKNELKSKIFIWERLNDSTYISRPFLKRMLLIHPSQFSYEIVKHNFTRKERKNMIKNAQ